MNHTPGPWNLSKSGDGKSITIGEGQSSWGTRVGEVYRDDIDSDEADANARLIAAAPEMLEALIDAYKIIRRHENPDLPGSAELRSIKALIERATGRKIEEVIDDRP